MVLGIVMPLCRSRRIAGMPLSRLLLVCLGGILSGACATTMHSHFDFDPGAAFAGYKSYFWMSDDRSTLPAGREPGISALNLNRIANSIEATLAAQGFARASDREVADFVISFTVGTREKTYIESYPRHYRGPWGWHPYYWDEQFITRTYTVGTLAIDIFDQQSRAPVWSGWTSKHITSRDREDPATIIAEAVAAILANFPPPAGMETAPAAR